MEIMSLQEKVKEQSKFEGMYLAILNEKEMLEAQLTQLLRQQLINSSSAKKLSKSFKKANRDESEGQKETIISNFDIPTDMKAITEREEEEEEDDESGPDKRNAVIKELSVRVGKSNVFYILVNLIKHYYNMLDINYNPSPLMHLKH